MTDETISQPAESEMAATPPETVAPETITPPSEGPNLAALAPAAGPSMEDQTPMQRPDETGTTAAMTEVPMPRAASDGAYLVVIGSFLEASHAEARQKQFADWQPRILEKQLDGKTFHRIVLGPYDKAGLAEARQRLKAAGIADNWAYSPTDEKLALMTLPKGG
jgi:cell division protein FtsN